MSLRGELKLFYRDRRNYESIDTTLSNRAVNREKSRDRRVGHVVSSAVSDWRMGKSQGREAV
jgi:hypothetical protein